MAPSKWPKAIAVRWIGAISNEHAIRAGPQGDTCHAGHDLPMAAKTATADARKTTAPLRHRSQTAPKQLASVLHRCTTNQGAPTAAAAAQVRSHRLPEASPGGTTR